MAPGATSPETWSLIDNDALARADVSVIINARHTSLTVMTQDGFFAPWTIGASDVAPGGVAEIIAPSSSWFGLDLDHDGVPELSAQPSSLGTERGLLFCAIDNDNALRCRRQTDEVTFELSPLR